MAIYCGIDFHPPQQSISYCDADDGEIHYRELHHESDDLHSFYVAIAPLQLWARIAQSCEVIISDDDDAAAAAMGGRMAVIESRR